MAQQLQVTLEQVCFVKPAQPTAVEHHLYLSAVDMLMRFSKPSRTLLFYPSPNCTRDENQLDVDDTFVALQRGLAMALVPYYPFAGRLAHLDGRLVLHCNDAGVELILARCNDIPFSDLASHNFLPRPFFRQLVPMDHLPRSDHIDAPIMSVQLTAFHGGLAVGIANQHSVADGFAFWMFIKALGEACRGKPFNILPLHYRALVRPETFMFNKFPPKPTPPKQDIVPCRDNSYSYSLIDSDPQRRLLQIVVHFSKEMIDTLKKAAACSSADTSFTTYQALSAYLWKRYIMARRFDDGEAVQFLHLLDIRHRIVPPLTSAFCGNAIAGFFTISSAREVREESLGATAARIQKTIKEVDDYSIKRFLVEVENPDLSNIPINLFRIRNASHFPVYEAGDFGWGKPEAARPPISDTEGEATWYPSQKPGSIDVVFALLDTTSSSFFSPNLYPNDPLGVPLLAIAPN